MTAKQAWRVRIPCRCDASARQSNMTSNLKEKCRTVRSYRGADRSSMTLFVFQDQDTHHILAMCAVLSTEHLILEQGSRYKAIYIGWPAHDQGTCL